MDTFVNKKVRELQEQINQEQSKMSRCTHQWAEAKYNPETKREPYGYKFRAQGSDTWAEPEGYRDVKKDRWTRICNICGKEEHTYEKAPVVTDYKPKFD